MPGVQDFFRRIDQLFMHADDALCRVFRAVQPDGERVCGSSFLMAVVNRGGSGPHIDGQDLAEGCCCVVPFGKDWTGGDLVFRDLGLSFVLNPGDVIFFRSALLVHENTPFVGDRRSIVLTTDRNSFTAVGQPLEPRIVAAFEASLLQEQSRYDTMPPTQRKDLLGKRLHARVLPANVASAAKENDSKAIKAKLHEKLVERINKPPLKINRAVRPLLKLRLESGMEPLSAKPPRATPKQKPAELEIKSEAGGNARSRNQYRL